MLYRPLGRTGLTVSEIGLGCASWWGAAAFAEREALALVHAAIDHGVTLFDTGSSYSGGLAEARLGRALKGKAAGDLVVATKAGTWRQGSRLVRDFSPAAIEAGVLRSLSNLGLDCLPLLQLHGVVTPELTDDLVDALLELRRRGLVRALGVNSFDPRIVDHVTAMEVFDVVMTDYNILRPERGPVVARAAERGKGVLAGMALAMGHPVGRTRGVRSRRDLWYALRALRHHRADVKRGRRFAFLNELSGMTGAQAALAYVLRDQNVASVVMGTTQMAHLVENIGASGLRLPDEVMARIEAAQMGSAR